MKEVQTMAESKRFVYKILFKGNTKKNSVDVLFTPELKETELKDVQTLLNLLTAGTHGAFIQLLAGMPMLRPASAEEREAHVYVFKDELDNKNYKGRKHLYQQIKNIFEGVLKELFPDVEYVNACNDYQQDLAFEMNEEQAEEHKKEIEDLTKRVREALKEDAC
jgi:hypothetical protein